MAIRKDSNGRPVISQVQPEAAITGGELYIRGKSLATSNRPHVTIGDVSAQVVVGSSSFVIVKVPEGASAGELIVENGKLMSDAWTCDIGIQIAENLHPVTSPAVDSIGNIYTTFSGSRGQKVPVAVYRIDLNFNATPFVNDMMNATAIAVGRDGFIYITSRFDGVVYQVRPSG